MGELLIHTALPPLTDTNPVFCQSCERWFEPDKTWRCAACGDLAAFACQPGTCENCDEPCLVKRDGNQLAPLCRCLWSPGKLAEAEARWADLEVIEQLEADILAGRRPEKKAGPPTLPDDAPARDWWPELLELIPSHLDRSNILDTIEAYRDDFPLHTLVSSLRTVLKRIKRRNTSVGSSSYILSALDRELGVA